MKTFSEEDLILYLYKESTPKMSAEIEEALADNLELSDRLTVLQRTIRQLDKLNLASPSKQSIRAIIRHAKSYK